MLLLLAVIVAAVPSAIAASGEDEEVAPLPLLSPPPPAPRALFLHLKLFANQPPPPPPLLLVLLLGFLALPVPKLGSDGERVGETISPDEEDDGDVGGRDGGIVNVVAAVVALAESVPTKDGTEGGRPKILAGIVADTAAAVVAGTVGVVAELLLRSTIWPSTTVILFETRAL